MSSLSDKFSCLGEKHKLESEKMRLLNELVNLNNVDFSNVNQEMDDLRLDQHDAVRQFRNWVRNNQERASTDEVVANIDSGVAMTEVAVESYSQAKHFANQIRQVAVSAANSNLSSSQKQNLKNQAKNMVEGIKAGFTNVSYNHIQNVFDSSSDDWNIQVGFSSSSQTINVAPEVPSYSDLESAVENMDSDAMAVLTQVDAFQSNVNSKVENNKGSRAALLDRRDRLVEEYKAVHKQLEVQRCEARKRLNAQLANSMKAISYLNICINHNSGV